MCVSVRKPQLFKIRYSMLLFVKKPQLRALSDGQAAALNLVLPPLLLRLKLILCVQKERPTQTCYNKQAL
jgi:hypothetical protein